MAQARRKNADDFHFQVDWLILGPAIALAILGLVMVASSSVAIAERNELPVYFYAAKHLVSLGLGVGLAWLVARIPLDNLERASPLLLLFCVALLLMVFVPGLGQRVNGAARWLDLGFMNFQVVEAVKIFFILYLAGHIVRHQERLSSGFRGLLMPCLTAGALAGLLLGQPDFGGAVLVLTVAVSLLWIGGVRVRDLFSLGLLALPIIVWLALTETYRLRRLRSFLDPWADPFDGGFQLTQALIAIGRGDLFGVGLGGSVQKLFYLPEAHTDFILAVLAEELGFVGVIAVMGLFAVLVCRGLGVAMRAMESGRLFSGLVCYGLALMIGLQAIISMGVNLGVLPTKGLTLPLISSGGSSVIMTAIAIGLMLRVSAEQLQDADAPLAAEARS